MSRHNSTPSVIAAAEMSVCKKEENSNPSNNKTTKPPRSGKNAASGGGLGASLNPIELPPRRTAAQLKSRRPNPNAKLPKSNTAMRSSARNLFKEGIQSPHELTEGTTTISSSSPLFKQVDSGERYRRRGIEKGDGELQLSNFSTPRRRGGVPAKPLSSGGKPKDMMTRQITREELLQFLDEESEGGAPTPNHEGAEDGDDELNQVLSNIDLDETVAVLLSPTKKRRSTPSRGRGNKIIHKTPVATLMSQKITPEVLNDLLKEEEEEEEEEQQQQQQSAGGGAGDEEEAGYDEVAAEVQAEIEAEGSTGAHPSPRKPAVSRPRSPEGKTPNKTEQQRSRTDGAGGGQNLFSGSSTD